MRLIHLLERHRSAIDQLRANPPADDRSDRDRREDIEDNRVYPNPLPFLSPRDPRWMDWHDRGDVAAHHVGGKTQVLPIDQLISTERFLEPNALKRRTGDRASSARPVIFKVDGNYLIADGNNRVVQAHLSGKPKMKVDVIDVDEYERGVA